MSLTLSLNITKLIKQSKDTNFGPYFTNKDALIHFNHKSWWESRPLHVCFMPNTNKITEILSLPQQRAKHKKRLNIKNKTLSILFIIWNRLMTCLAEPAEFRRAVFISISASCIYRGKTKENKAERTEKIRMMHIKLNNYKDNLPFSFYQLPPFHVTNGSENLASHSTTGRSSCSWP